MKEKIFVLGLLILSLVLRAKLSLEFVSLSVIAEIAIFFFIYLIIRKFNLLLAEISLIFFAVSPWLIVLSPFLFSRGWLKINPVSPIVFVKNYFFLFSGDYLFYKGIWPIKLQSLNYQGMMYWTDIIFIILGLKEIFLKNKRFFEKFLLISLLIFPIPASLTGNLTLYPLLLSFPLIILSAKGALSLIKTPKFLTIILLANLYFLIRFLDLYFLHY
ncbi:hypothetical protein COS54_03375 [Candidatus Shapirobacteria bacterium CG03_land_8_20_14_0_80_39_12]|uniref:Glycosyltransferase RgtA/B/C/D-like domain-containing protein n=1 Tax=Candidatus Shapirobacteria bacterium CG03_land_8_20_14_0_80_39_12 TaxID=1974879 RepID=A0A2M7BAU6_9BACT|nr:MAG: hypothetical protein COS54_03375 [Candidatus Shapirobacteria bacterium CG03_land_8_20_14_0_80_39_12]